MLEKSALNKLVVSHVITLIDSNLSRDLQQPIRWFYFSIALFCYSKFCILHWLCDIYRSVCLPQRKFYYTRFLSTYILNHGKRKVSQRDRFYTTFTIWLLRLLQIREMILFCFPKMSEFALIYDSDNRLVWPDGKIIFQYLAISKNEN